MTSANLLYSAAQARALDQLASQQGTSGYLLMKRAGEAALRALRSRWPMARRVVVVAGGGNNGGDGYVLARFAQAAGLEVSVMAVTPLNALHGDARIAADDFCASGGHLLPWSVGVLATADVVVDALLGIGLQGPVRAPQLAVIKAMNASDRPVLALDIPSGLDADSGHILGEAVRADCTISFVALKVGLFLAQGPECCGRLVFDDLEVDPTDEDRFRPLVERMGEIDIQRALVPRQRDANKGQFGRVLIVGGGRGMGGAARLAGEAALRVGAGLVSVAVAPENVAAIVGARPELMVHGIGNVEELDALMQQASVIAVGPGLGQDAWAQALWNAVLGSGKPLVMDADGLNLLAQTKRSVPAGCVLTPHPGEAARLLGCSVADVQADRLQALQRLVSQYEGSAVVLKGAGSLLGLAGQTIALCEYGNPAMATAGMGDVLTGAVAGLLAQCKDPWLALRAAVLSHALAGDDLGRDLQRGMLALDLAKQLTKWVNLKL